MGTTGVPNGYHGCTKWVPRVYQMGTTGVPNGYHGCTKWAAGKRSGVAKRCWALWRCVFVCLRGHIRWHLRVCCEFGRSITITGQLARLSILSRRQISGPSSFMRTTSAVGVLAIPRNSSAFPPQFLRNSSAVRRNSSAIPAHFRRNSAAVPRNSSAIPQHSPRNSRANPSEFSTVSFET